MTTEKLLPCPFCGANESERDGARGTENSKDCYIILMETELPNSPLRIMAWNTRSIPSPEQGESCSMCGGKGFIEGNGINLPTVGCSCKSTARHPSPEQVIKVEYQSKVSGLWYQSIHSAGGLNAIKIDGVIFLVRNELEDEETVTPTPSPTAEQIAERFLEIHKHLVSSMDDSWTQIALASHLEATVPLLREIEELKKKPTAMQILKAISYDSLNKKAIEIGQDRDSLSQQLRMDKELLNWLQSQVENSCNKIQIEEGSLSHNIWVSLNDDKIGTGESLRAAISNAKGEGK